MNNKLTQFWATIKQQLSAADFDQLQKDMGASNYKWTALQNGTKDFSSDELDALSNFLKQPKSELISKYGLGLTHLRGTEIVAIANADGQPITLAG